MTPPTDASAGSPVAQRPGRVWVPVLALAGLALLGVGLTVPILEVERLFDTGRSYSVLTGAAEFLRSGRWYLGVLVLAFSAVFPVAKLLLLLVAWTAPLGAGRRARIVRWVDRLGKWSMLDVYVAVFTAGAVRLGMLADAEIRWGLYAFGSAVVISMVASTATLRLAGLRRRLALDLDPDRRVDHLPLVTGLGIPLMVLGMALPLLEVEKWVFWTESFSIFSGAARLFAQGNPLLAVGFALFVVLLPLVHQGALFLLSAAQATGRGSSGTLGVLRGVEEWAMLDVFGLALFVGAVGLSDLAALEPRAGLWYFGGGLFCSAYGTFWIRRIYEKES